MPKKVIINESVMKEIFAKEILEEGGLTKAEIADAVKDAIKNDSTVNKDIEKKVKKLVADCVNNLFRTLWMRRNFYEDEIKK